MNQRQPQGSLTSIAAYTCFLILTLEEGWPVQVCLHVGLRANPKTRPNFAELFAMKLSLVCSKQIWTNNRIAYLRGFRPHFHYFIEPHHNPVPKAD